MFSILNAFRIIAFSLFCLQNIILSDVTENVVDTQDHSSRVGSEEDDSCEETPETSGHVSHNCPLIPWENITILSQIGVGT